MKKAVIEADVHASTGDVFDFLMDVENYGRYSGYVDDVRVLDDTDTPLWEIEFSWWLVNYTAMSKVVDYEENRFIEWRVVKDVDVRGVWKLDATGDEETHVALEVWYERDSARKVNPLRLIPTHRLIALAKPVASSHIKTVLRRVTRELEGEPRDLDFEFSYLGDSEESNFVEVMSELRSKDVD